MLKYNLQGCLRAPMKIPKFGWEKKVDTFNPPPPPSKLRLKHFHLTHSQRILIIHLKNINIKLELLVNIWYSIAIYIVKLLR